MKPRITALSFLFGIAVALCVAATGDYYFLKEDSGKIEIIKPTGTADSTTFLRGDGTWASPSTVIAAPRAWVRFNGTGVVAIDSAYNVSSITDNGSGDYTVNFSSAMSDTSYAIIGTADNRGSANANSFGVQVTTIATGSLRLLVHQNGSATGVDTDTVSIVVYND